MTQITLSGTAVEVPNHVLGMTDLADNWQAIIQTALRFKQQAKVGPLQPLLAGKAVLLIFEKQSTRTRVSFEVGIQRLGGIAVCLDANSTQMSRGEIIEDTSNVLSRYSDAIVYRAYKHTDVAEMAEHATVPIVNALTELEHPCQIMADWMTLTERWGDLQGKTFAYIGDGNNMCHSYLLGAAIAGMHVRIATPSEYAPDAAIVEQAEVIAAMNGCTVTLTDDPKEAVQGADAVATDTWVSMGDEAEEAARNEAFHGYTIDDDMMALADAEALFLHCLPGHWGHEATYEVAHGPRSVIYDEAENRMWVQMAMLVHLLGRVPN